LQTLKSLQTELYTLKDDAYDLRLKFVIAEAENQNIRLLINEYAETALYLTYLNDLPLSLTQYGKAVGALNNIEHRRPMPTPCISNWPWLLNKDLFLLELKTTIYTNYKQGNDLKTLYNNIWWFHIKHYTVIQALLTLLKASLSISERLNTKTTILLLYADLFKTEEFNSNVRQPLKDRCVMLLNEMENLVGQGAIVRPDTKHLIGGTETQLFVRVPRDFDDHRLPDCQYHALTVLHDRMLELQNKINKIQSAVEPENAVDE